MIHAANLGTAAHRGLWTTTATPRRHRLLLSSRVGLLAFAAGLVIAAAVGVVVASRRPGGRPRFGLDRPGAAACLGALIGLGLDAGATWLRAMAPGRGGGAGLGVLAMLILRPDAGRIVQAGCGAVAAWLAFRLGRGPGLGGWRSIAGTTVGLLWAALAAYFTTFWYPTS